MKTLFTALCAVFLLTAVPTLAASTPPKTETAESVKADMKDQMAKLKQQHKDQATKLRAQQKDQLAKLKADQKQQVAKLKADQKARWQKFQDQEEADDTPAATRKGKS